jgi:NCAIR mutase (PurE)-related protein
VNERVARLDHDRLPRQGFPEVVFATGKSGAHVAEIMTEFVRVSGHALATRATHEHAAAVGTCIPQATFDPVSRLIRVGSLEPPPGFARLTAAVATGGTSDLPVAEECVQTLEWAGIGVERYYDIGVAGLERLLSVEDRLRAASAIVVVAGMEGALPSVLGGRVACPVIAVPTSVGYGASFEGLSALLGMLTSCVPGVSVVNIDNGFGAAAVVNRMFRMIGGSKR